MLSWITLVPVLFLATAPSPSTVVQVPKQKAPLVEKCMPQVWLQDPDGGTECFVDTPEGRMDCERCAAILKRHAQVEKRKQRQ